jgi:hypothetical protein
MNEEDVVALWARNKYPEAWNLPMDIETGFGWDVRDRVRKPKPDKRAKANTKGRKPYDARIIRAHKMRGIV